MEKLVISNTESIPEHGQTNSYFSKEYSTKKQYFVYVIRGSKWVFIASNSQIYLKEGRDLSL